MRQPFAHRGPFLVVGVLTAVLVGYVFRFGSNAPVMDEWDLAPELREFVADGRAAEWVFLRHNEHRYPAARLLYLLLMTATGYDFRSGMVASALLLGGAAAVFVVAARAVRGRASVADILAPALLLNWGAGFNVLMGYQLAFALTVLAAAVACWVVVTDRRAAVAGVALFGLVVNGAAGLCIAVPFTGWIVARAVRTPDRRERIIAGLAVIATAAYAAWAISSPSNAPPGRVPAGQAAVAAGQFLTMGLGPWVMDGNWAIPLALTAAGYAGLALMLGWRLVHGSEDRVRTAGLLALVGGVVGMAAGVGWGRGGGLVERYASLAAVGLLVGWVAVARWAVGPAVGVVVLAAVGVYAVNLEPGRQFGTRQRMHYKELAAAGRDGLSPAFVADRFRGLFFPNATARDRIDRFRRLGFVGFRDLPPDPRLDADAPTSVRTPADPAVSLPLPADQGQPVYGVRVGLELEADVPWLELQVEYVRPDGTRGRSFVHPARTRGRQTTQFFIRDDVASARLVSTAPTAGLVVHEVEWLRPAAGWAVGPSPRTSR